MDFDLLEPLSWKRLLAILVWKTRSSVSRAKTKWLNGCKVNHVIVFTIISFIKIIGQFQPSLPYHPAPIPPPTHPSSHPPPLPYRSTLIKRPWLQTSNLTQNRCHRNAFFHFKPLFFDETGIAVNVTDSRNCISATANGLFSCIRCVCI